MPRRYRAHHRGCPAGSAWGLRGCNPLRCSLGVAPLHSTSGAPGQGPWASSTRLLQGPSCQACVAQGTLQQRRHPRDLHAGLEAALPLTHRCTASVCVPISRAQAQAAVPQAAGWAGITLTLTRAWPSGPRPFTSEGLRCQAGPGTAGRV